MNFTEQSRIWLRELETRKRKPVSPATLRTFRNHVRILVGFIGDVPLAEVNNGSAKSVVAGLCEQGYASKTVNEVLSAMKSVVASAIEPTTGEPLFPRNWNSRFIDAPIVADQRQPCLTRQEVEARITHAKTDQEKLFYCVLAGTGLRVSEALAIRVNGLPDQTSWSNEDGTIHVRSRMYRDQEQPRLKTPAARRDVDLYPQLNALIARYVVAHQIQPGGFLFQSRMCGPMFQVTAMLRLMRLAKRLKLEPKGWHAFRRFRITVLRGYGTPEEIVRSWVGHSPTGITDKYSKLAEDVGLRKQWAGKALGFTLPEFFEPKNVAPPNISTPKTASAKPETVEEHYVATDEDLPLELFESPTEPAMEVK